MCAIIQANAERSKEGKVNYESFLELVQMRRSIRRFKPDPIPDEYLDKIIEAARWAPSGANSQPWEFITVKKQGLKDSIVELYEENRALYYRVELTREPDERFPTYARPPEGTPGFATAPVFIIMCGDPRTKDAYPFATDPSRRQSHFISGLASAFLYMNLAATTLGLGSQWVSGTGGPREQILIKDMLGIPQKLEIYDMLAVGYPAYEPRPRLLRAREEMVHHDYYDKSKFRTDEEVRDSIITFRGVVPKQTSP